MIQSTEKCRTCEYHGVAGKCARCDGESNYFPIPPTKISQMEVAKLAGISFDELQSAYKNAALTSSEKITQYVNSEPFIKSCKTCGLMNKPGECPSCQDDWENWQPIEPTTPDPVNSPSHYQHGGIETIDIIRSMLTAEEFRGYLKGNILKYRERAMFKGKTDEDYAKAKKYYDWLKEAT